ncbi:MAG: L-serine ammonia-lyase [Spartobacteria bacterium]|nr:L-serine ammonia-lyase [Spartobacteria bacterium]
MSDITTSLFDLFKIGPGPSSSHTIGPMKAGYDFIQTCLKLPVERQRKAAAIQVHLYGSLSLTGKGHGTDRAALGGLMNVNPVHCPQGFLSTLLEDEQVAYTLKMGEQSIPFTSSNIIFHTEPYDSPFSNTMVVQLCDKSGTLLFEREYYSVGGGFIQWKGEEPPVARVPTYPYGSIKQFRQVMHDNDMRLCEVLLENEKAVTGLTETEIYAKIDRILEVFDETVAHGLNTEGILPGPLKYHRRAPGIHRRALRLEKDPNHFMLLLTAYALAGAEENADGEPVVTSPTCGSYGTMAGMIYMMRHVLKIEHSTLQDSLLAAALVGFLAKNNASISGAEVGCQGEVGVASAMAAAMMSYAKTSDVRIMEHAAEKALEHHLGMTCDPVQGYVQIPCIERNAFGAVKAYLSHLMAISEVSSFHRVGLDSTIQAMYETGLDLMSKYRETGIGGLAHLVE